MHRFVRQIQEKRLRRVGPVLQPLQRLVGQHVGRVAGNRFPASVDIQHRIEVLALATETDPVVETRLRGISVVAHVPLADKGGRVAGLLQILGKEHCPLRHGPLVVDHAMMMHVLAGQDGRAAGRAQGRADKGVDQVCAFGRHAIQVRCFQELGIAGQEAQEVVAVVVAEHQHDIPRRGAIRRLGGGGEFEIRAPRETRQQQCRQTIPPKSKGDSGGSFRVRFGHVVSGHAPRPCVRLSSRAV